MSTRVPLCFAFFMVASALLASSAEAQWQLDGILLSAAGGDQYAPTIVPDGAGGAIIAWADDHSTPQRIYAQHLNAAGVPQWAANGIPLCTTGGNQFSPAAVGDGGGGAIVAWADSRAGNFDIYAQHIDASGTPLWGSGGLAICLAANDQIVPVIISDLKANLPAPGAIIAWQDSRSGVPNIYAQSVDGQLGAVRWAANGVAVAPTAASQTDPVMCTDGMGVTLSNPKGAIIAWTDSRNAGVTGQDIYAQRMSAGGVPQWGASGLPVCTAAGAQQLPSIVFLFSGNVIVAWADSRSGSSDIYAQHVGGGTVQWAAGGIPLCGAAGDQISVNLATDVSGGAIAAWEDGRNATDHDIYAQRVDGTGAVLWSLDGASVCAASGRQMLPAVATDQVQGALVAWVDQRAVDRDVYGQRIDSSGVSQGNPDGVRLGRRTIEYRPQIISDNAQGAIVAWTHSDGFYDKVYANRIFANGGAVGVPTGPVAAFRLFTPFPNPARAATTVAFELPSAQRLTAEVFDLDGRLVRTLARGREFPSGREALRWDGRTEADQAVPDGMYFLEVHAEAGSAVRRILVIH